MTESYSAMKGNEWLITCNNRNESQNPSAERERPDPSKSTCYMIPYLGNSRRCKLISSDRKQKMITWITKGSGEETSLVYTYVQT